MTKPPTIVVCSLFLLAPLAAPATRGQSPDCKQLESRWIRNVRQLTSVEMGLDKAGEAYFSPDMKRISFQAFPKGRHDYQIYVMNIDGTGLEMVSTGKGATTCSYFSPDGKRLIFASNHLDPRPVAAPKAIEKAASKAGKRDYRWSFYPGMDIFEYTFATGKLRRIVAAPGYDAECAYSPDGKQIVFSSMRDGDQEIYICNADGTNQHRITRVPGYDGGPFFAPDGKHIVYRSDRHGDGNMAIYVNNLQGTAEKALTDASCLHWCPYWHPSGKWLIYTKGIHYTDRRPEYDLYLLSADGSEEHRVTCDPAFDGLPVFSPDGKKLMWTSKRNGLKTSQVFIADFVGLTPDGKLLAKKGKARREQGSGQGIKGSRD